MCSTGCNGGGGGIVCGCSRSMTTLGTGDDWHSRWKSSCTWWSPSPPGAGLELSDGEVMMGCKTAPIVALGIGERRAE